MTPYYEDETVRLFHGDCREIVPALGLTADLIVTDPPYGETSLAWDRWPDGWPAALTGAARSMWVFGSMRMFLDRRDEFAAWRLSQDVVWEKTRRSGVATDRFARIHEHVTHWYRGDWGSVYHQTPKVAHDGPSKGSIRRSAIEPGTRGAYGATGWEDDGTRWHPSVFRARAMHRSGAINETQKPIKVVEGRVRRSRRPAGGPMTRLACQRPDSGASLEVVPVFANGPTGLVSITISLSPGDHLTVHVEAAAFADSLLRAIGEPS